MPGEKLGEYYYKENRLCPGATRRGLAQTHIGMGTISMRGFGDGSPHHIVYPKTPDLSPDLITNHLIFIRTQKKRNTKIDFVVAWFVLYWNVIFRNGVNSSIPGNVGHPELGEEPFLINLVVRSFCRNALEAFSGIIYSVTPY